MKDWYTFSSPKLMKEEEVQFQFKIPATYGWLEVKLPHSLINHIWDCVSDAHGNAKSSLIGHIDKSLVIQDKNYVLWDQLLRPLTIAYGKQWSHGHYKMPLKHKHELRTGERRKDDYTFYLDSMWVNYQNQHEFNPVHNHGGCYSFAAWLKIPTEYQEQNQHYNAKDSNGSLNSAFCFHYTDSLGNIRTTVYEQYPNMEGTLLFFPSALNHEVYPFYNCDKQRISISGNIWLKEK